MEGMEISLVVISSFVAAFLAGMVALFAPCCITFLLPAYLGSVFREKRKIILMTLVFGLGIFIVLMPAVLGVSALSRFLFRSHDVIYYTGGAVMVLSGVMALLNIKLPMLSFAHGKKLGDRPDVASVFVLGIFSGLTSACCAPVLVGILSLAFLSPSFFLALTVGGFYVLGMVAPLLVAGLVVDRKRLLTGMFMRRRVGPFMMGNVIAAVIFIPMGLVMIFLTMTGKLSMESMKPASSFLQNAAGRVTELFNSKRSDPSLVMEQSDDGAGGVTVTAKVEGNEIELSLDTHQGNLLEYDVKEDVSVVTTAHNTLTPQSVTTISDASHHRRFKLVFYSLSIPFTIRVNNLAGVSIRELVFAEERR